MAAALELQALCDPFVRRLTEELVIRLLEVGRHALQDDMEGVCLGHLKWWQATFRGRIRVPRHGGRALQENLEQRG